MFLPRFTDIFSLPVASPTSQPDPFRIYTGIQLPRYLRRTPAPSTKAAEHRRPSAFQRTVKRIPPHRGGGAPVTGKKLVFNYGNERQRREVAKFVTHEKKWRRCPATRRSDSIINPDRDVASLDLDSNLRPSFMGAASRFLRYWKQTHDISFG